MKRVIILLSFVFLLASAAAVSANNIQVTNVSLPAANKIQFDISWENSWRVTSPPANYDAAWVFVKRRDCAANTWYHVTLSTTGADHTAAAPLSVQATTDGIGVFIQRSASGSGNIAATTVTLTTTGVPAGEYDFQVFAVEMVYIPAGNFTAGDGASTYTLYNFNTGNPFVVTSGIESAVLTIEPANVANYMWAGGNLVNGATFQTVATYPKGYSAFYCMKYEVSQDQYLSFINCLPADAAAVRATTSGGRNTYSGSWPSFTTTTPNRAQGYLSWSDLLAYLDWSGLRPMTELEFEKAARGPVTPVAGEYAWGTTGVTDANTAINDGTPTEAVSDVIGTGNGIANYGNNSILGPLRCGFAAGAATNRYTAGASYYGVMELSGNVWERVVTLYSTVDQGNALAYTGLNGDGVLTTTPTPGRANTAAWPGNISTDNGLGNGLRGGAFDSTLSARLRVSDRNNAADQDNNRTSNVGGRGVREP